MRRLLKTWRSWPLDRRLAAVLTAVAVAGSFVVVSYLTAKRPGDQACPPPCSLQIAQAHPRRPPQQPPGPQQKADTTRDWPMFGYDAARTKYMAANTVKPPFKARWGWDSGELLEFSPIVVRDVLYGIDNKGDAFALDSQTGKVLWRRDVGTLSANSPAYDHGRIFLVTLEPGQAVALRAKDGKVLWRHPLAGRAESSPVVLHGRVIFGCECARIYALDSKDGSEVWSTGTAAEVKAAVAISNGVAYVGDYAGQMYALDASDGSVQWTSASQGSGFGVAGRFYSTPAVAFGRVFVGSVDGRVYSFDASNGDLAWSQSTGDWVYGGVVAADPPGAPPSVFAGSFDNHAYSFDARTGEIRWSKDVGGIISGAGSVIGTSYYVSTLGGKTYGLDVVDGSTDFDFGFGQYNPAISDGRWLYITGYSGITALAPVDESKLHKGSKPHPGKDGGGKAKRPGPSNQGPPEKSNGPVHQRQASRGGPQPKRNPPQAKGS